MDDMKDVPERAQCGGTHKLDKPGTSVLARPHQRRTASTRRWGLTLRHTGLHNMAEHPRGGEGGSRETASSPPLTLIVSFAKPIRGTL